MEEYKLNIPSVVSHSYFTLLGKKTHLSEKEVNYFYSLLYLFRENITSQSKVKIFNKVSENKSEINENFENFTVQIELIEFNDLGVVSNHTYDNLIAFFRKLKNREIVVNILGKDKTIDIQSIRLIEKYKIKDNVLHIKITDELLYLILHNTEYFMEVDLNILFKMSGYKSKKLYLFLKDYSLFKNKCINITKKNLENLIGRIPSSKESFKTVIDNTNTIKTVKSDLKIEYPTISGRKLKKYEFRFEDLVEKEPDKQSTNSEPSKTKKEIPKEVKDIVDKRINEKIKKGETIHDLDGYKHKSYQNEIEKDKPKGSEKNIQWLEDFVNNKIKVLKENTEIDYTEFPYFCFYHKSNPYPLYIDNNYCIYHIYGDIKTSNVDETVKKIKEWINNKEIRYEIIIYAEKYKLCNIELFRVKEN